MRTQYGTLNKPSKEERKQKRIQKKAVRKKKKEQKANKRNGGILYSPEKMKGFPCSVLIGYLLRFFAIAFSLFGVLWLFCDAFLLKEISAGYLLLYCFGAVTAFSLIFIGKWFILAGIGIIGAYLGAFYLMIGSPLTFFVSGVEEVINRIMIRLSDAGFAASGGIDLPYLGSGLTYAVSRQQTLTYGGIFALATVLALIFAAFSAKRTRLLPMIITGGGLCTFCFTYNLCETNWGIACVLAGLCSAAVLSAYDKTYKAHKHSKKSRAYSGYSAALAGVLALLILLIPAANMTEPWGEIGFISKPMRQARTVMTTILTGGNPEYNRMNSLTDQRSNALEEVKFNNVQLFEVHSYSKRAIYLRSWIAKDYDYSKTAWNQLSSIDYDEMVRVLQNESKGFTGDQIAYDRYTLLDERLSEQQFPSEAYVSSSTLGYVGTFVDIDYINNSGLLYVLPSSYISSLGLFEFESRIEGYHNSYDLYSDGMYTSGWFNLFKSYTAAAILPNYMIDNYGQVSAQTVLYFDKLIDFIENLNSYGTDNSAELISLFRNELDQAGLVSSRYSTAALENYLSLSNNERTRWYNRYVRLYREYTEYVHSAYTSVPSDSEGINRIYDEIEDKLDAAANDHDKIMVIINYLASNYTYSTSPAVSDSRTYENDLDYFLLEGKEGYCVQFASAAALLLRKAGFPTRYVQGYIADNFERTTDADGSINYTSAVYDNAAHAWVEVYIDGLGWRTYETTPAYYDSLYFIEEASEDPNAPVITTPSITTSDVTLPPVTDSDTVTTNHNDLVQTAGQNNSDNLGGASGKISFDAARLVKIALLLIAVALVIALVIWQLRRAKKISDGRSYFIDRAEYGSFEEKADFDQVAGVLCDSIYEVHYIIGNRPKQGELPTEFAARIEQSPPADDRRAQKMYNRMAMLPSSLSEITPLIEKQEFGKVMNRSELAALGSYLRALINSEYPHLPFWKKLWYRYIRFMI